MATQPVEILRAAMGAVALRFALIARGLDEAGEKEVVSTGAGLLGSPAWTRIMADALGKSVRASVVPEASSRAAPLCSLSRLYRQPVDRGGRGSLW
jgi:gluconokinase